MPPDAPQWLIRKTFALINEAHTQSRQHRLALMSWIIWRNVTSTNELGQPELECIAHTLEYWQRLGEIESRARTAADNWLTRQQLRQPDQDGTAPSTEP